MHKAGLTAGDEHDEHHFVPRNYPELTLALAIPAEAAVGNCQLSGGVIGDDFHTVAESDAAVGKTAKTGEDTAVVEKWHRIADLIGRHGLDLGRFEQALPVELPF